MTIPRDRLSLVLGDKPEPPGPAPVYATDLLEMALKYASLGFRVLPVWWVAPSGGGCGCPKELACGKSPAKHPILFDWPKLATTDEATIRGWWSRWPLANIGLAMGGGVVAVDIDCIYALEALEDHGLPGATPTQHTGSGGLHKLYRYAKSRDLKNAVRFQEGVDLRTDGGFIIAAPSVNTKGSYHWDGDLDISTPLAELPQWIADACAVGVNIHRPPLQITDLWAGVPEGTRNGRLFSYACKMRREKRPALEILAVCLELGRRCLPPMPTDEVTTIVESSGRYADKREDDGLVCVPVWPDLMQMDLKPKVQIVSPWLRERDIVMIHAWRGIGKTWVTLSLGLSVSTGAPFFKWPTVSPRGVLLVDGEMSTPDLRTRIAMLMKGAGGKEPVCQFNLITHDLQERGITSLDTSTGQDYIEQKLDGIGLLILDNISTLFRGGARSTSDENDSSSWNTAQEWLLALRKRGIVVVLVHHSGKSGAQRGTSKREDILDSVIQLRRPSDYLDAQGARFEWRFEKLRGASGKEIEPFDAQLEVDEKVKSAIWLIRNQKDTRDEQVIEMVGLGMAQNIIAQELGCSRSTLARAIRRLRAEGKISGGMK